MQLQQRRERDKSYRCFVLTPRASGPKCVGLLNSCRIAHCLLRSVGPPQASREASIQLPERQVARPYSACHGGNLGQGEIRLLRIQACLEICVCWFSVNLFSISCISTVDYPGPIETGHNSFTRNAHLCYGVDIFENDAYSECIAPNLRRMSLPPNQAGCALLNKPINQADNEERSTARGGNLERQN